MFSAFKVVDQVRMSPSVKRFVYVCNNHKSPVRLFLDFCASPLERGTYNFTGLPFVPVRIIPIDLAPHTPHSQLLVLFERVGIKRIFYHYYYLMFSLSFFINPSFICSVHHQPVEKIKN